MKKIKKDKKDTIGMIPLPDIIFNVAKRLNIDQLRQEFMDLKNDIIQKVKLGEIKGIYGREVLVDKKELNNYIKEKRKEKNITSLKTEDDIRDLLIDMHTAKLTASEQLNIIINRL